MEKEKVFQEDEKAFCLNPDCRNPSEGFEGAAKDFVIPGRYDVSVEACGWCEAEHTMRRIRPELGSGIKFYWDGETFRE